MSKNIMSIRNIYKQLSKKKLCFLWKKILFFKQNRNNKYVNIYIHICAFWKYKLQINISTICSDYAIFFVHSISLWEYDATCFYQKYFKKDFNLKNILNDKYSKKIFIFYIS